MNSTVWLIVAVIVLPALWGWGVEAAMRRLRRNASPVMRPSSPSREAGDGVVDFQI